MLFNPYEYVKREREAVVEHIIDKSTGDDVNARLWCSSIGGVTIITDDEIRYKITAEPEGGS